MCKTIFEKGTIKTNKEVNRKHISQMNRKEIEYLVKELNNLDNLKLSNHAWDKVYMIGLNISNIKRLLHKYNQENIIEYNTGRGNGSRVLVRDSKAIITDEGIKVHVCYVIELKSSQVITAYINKSSDYHSTLQYDNYNRYLKII